MSTNHLLSSSQHGFRSRLSTETALLTVTDHILSATDQQELTVLCLLDLSKCFDVINHAKLLSKLQTYCVDPSWFASYLQGHTQSVCTVDGRGNRHFSKPLPNPIGVFQGSSHGPLLFLIFANDLLSSLRTFTWFSTPMILNFTFQAKRTVSPGSLPLWNRP